MLISVIVPVYNTEKFLDKCVTSILNQTYKELELILVNDGSQDLSGQICDKYQKLDNRVIVINKENGGVSSARNQGLDIATGDWITFVDSDDWLEVNAYEKLIELAKLGNADIIVTTAYYRNMDELKRTDHSGEKEIYTSKEAAKLLLDFKLPASLCMSIYEASLIKETYLKDEIHYWEDIEYQFRLFNKAANIGINKNPFYHYREGSITHNTLCEKKLSCLQIPEILKKSSSHNDEEMDILINKLEIAFVFDLALLGAKDKKHDKKLDFAISKSARKCLQFIWGTEDYKIKKKVHLAILSISPRLYYQLFHIKYLYK